VLASSRPGSLLPDPYPLHHRRAKSLCPASNQHRRRIFPGERQTIPVRGAGNNRGRLREAGARLAVSLPFSGHPTGYAMACHIRKHLGDEVLLSLVADPAGFLRAYGKAAALAGEGDPLGDQTLELLELVVDAARG